MTSNFKDWQIAQMMFGINKQKECAIVKKLRKYNTVEPFCEGWSMVYDKFYREDEWGWLIPNECL